MNQNEQGGFGDQATITLNAGAVANLPNVKGCDDVCGIGNSRNDSRRAEVQHGCGSHNGLL